MAESASSACGCSDVNERDRRVINAHRVFEGAFTRWRECWFLLREHERAIVGFFLAMSAASHIAARQSGSLRAGRLLKRECARRFGRL